MLTTAQIEKLLGHNEVVIQCKNKLWIPYLKALSELDKATAEQVAQYMGRDIRSVASYLMNLKRCGAIRIYGKKEKIHSNRMRKWVNVYENSSCYRF